MSHEDIVMKDLDIGRATSYVSFSRDENIRSPRTPIYSPDSSFLSMMTPFDAVALLGNASLRRTSLPKPTASAPPPPTRPLDWIWQCHTCKARWRLGTTRRCLHDGHFYCSGDTDQLNLKKKKKGQSCSSEFDYVGWQEWGQWRRKVIANATNPRVRTGCEMCEYPSQCRYSKNIKVVDGRPTSAAATKDASSKADEDSTRFYSNENASAESIIPNDKEDKKTKAESQANDAHRTEKKARSMSPTSTDRPLMPPVQKSVRKNTLSPIEEDALSGMIDQNMQELIMPVLAYLKEKKEHKK